MDGDFTNNGSPGNGGVFFASEFSTISLAGGFFQGNRAHDGGVLMAIGGSIVYIEGGVYSGNVAASAGGSFSLTDGAQIKVRDIINSNRVGGNVLACVPFDCEG